MAIYRRELHQVGYLKLAREAMDKEEFKTALEYFDKTLASNVEYRASEEKFIYSGKAYCLGCLGNLTDALENYDKVIAIDPQNTGWLQEKGNLLLENNRWEEALECFNAALGMDPENSVSAWAAKAKAEKELGQNTQARESFLRWLNFLSEQCPEIQLQLYADGFELYGLVSEHDLAKLDRTVLERIRNNVQP
ncbi:MAG TPA: tetratricopeptide repeat protein [Candidatus Omnitrophota bacterium]|nr:tetratricopeptide repeat protein [Candidatus Omnitrophota bacterium]